MHSGVLTDGHSPGSRARSGILSITVWAVVIAVLLFTGYAGYEGWHGEFIPGFLYVGTMLSCFFWGSQRLWTIAVMPIVAGHQRWVEFVSRIPFWCMAGGIGYTAGMLSAAKLGLLIVQDRPVELLFVFGGKFGIAVQCAASVIMYRNTKREKERAR